MRKVLYLGSDPKRFFPENAEVIHFPLIEIIPRSPYLPQIVSSIADWHEYTHIVFTSKHAVEILANVLQVHRLAPHNCEIFAVGSSTARALENFGWKVSQTAQEEIQEGIVDLLRGIHWTNTSYVLLPRSALARGVIEQFLLERMLRYQICDLYDTVPRAVRVMPDLEQFDEIFFTSPSTVSAFFAQVKILPQRPILRAIGEVTLQNLARATMICSTLLPT